MLEEQLGGDGTASLDGGGQSEVLGPWKEPSWVVGGPGLKAAEMMNKLKNATAPIGLDSGVTADVSEGPLSSVGRGADRTG